MSRTSPTGCSKIILPDLARIAIETRLVIRKSNRFSAEAFLHSLLFSVVSGQGSLNQIVASLKDRVSRSMSRQSLWERFSSRSTAFLQRVLCELMEQRFQHVATTLKTSSIRRLILEDASGQALPKSNIPKNYLSLFIQTLLNFLPWDRERPKVNVMAAFPAPTPKSKNFAPVKYIVRKCRKRIIL